MLYPSRRSFWLSKGVGNSALLGRLPLSHCETIAIDDDKQEST
jgi:hypothetical protein